MTLPGGREIDDLKDTLPEEEAIFFLRNKGTEGASLGFNRSLVAAESPYYRLVSSQGLIRDIAGSAVPPQDADDPFLLAVRGQSFARVRDAILATP